jgi:4-nitrophenyl phosphatase
MGHQEVPMGTVAALTNIRNILIDLDGVIYRGDIPLPGATHFIQWLRSREIGHVFLTNNSTRTPQQYVDKLARLQVPAAVPQILTSALATRVYLENRAARGTPVYVIGERGLHEALLGDGYFFPEEQTPSYVVVGMDRQVTYEKLRLATLAIRAGAAFIGTNPDRTFPSPEGITPGCGAILAALEASTDTRPTIIGKPEPWSLQEGMRRLGADPATTAMLGDRLETDILGGRRLGLTTVMVLTGVHGRKEIEASSCPPDIVFPDLIALQQAWQAALEGR